MPLIGDWSAALLAGRSIRAFNDMTLAPTPTEMVSAAIGALLADHASGVYQLTGPRDVTYAELGRFVPPISRRIRDRDGDQRVISRFAGGRDAPPHHTEFERAARELRA